MRTKLLIRSNQPIIQFHSYQQKSRTVDYDSDEEEDVNEVAKSFKYTFIKQFDKSKLKKKEYEVVKGFQSQTVHPEEYLAVLTEEEQEQMKEGLFDKTKSC
jgi:hypothetical protein